MALHLERQEDNNYYDFVIRERVKVCFDTTVTKRGN